MFDVFLSLFHSPFVLTYSSDHLGEQGYDVGFSLFHNILTPNSTRNRLDRYCNVFMHGCAVIRAASTQETLGGSHTLSIVVAIPLLAGLTMTPSVQDPAPAPAPVLLAQNQPQAQQVRNLGEVDKDVKNLVARTLPISPHIPVLASIPKNHHIVHSLPPKDCRIRKKKRSRIRLTYPDVMLPRPPRLGEPCHVDDGTGKIQRRGDEDVAEGEVLEA